MTLLKLVFVLLILIPVALIMMYILDNLLKEAKGARNATIDMQEAKEAQQIEKRKAKRNARIKSIRESVKNTGPSQPIRTRSGEERKAKRKKRSRQASGHQTAAHSRPQQRSQSRPQSRSQARPQSRGPSEQPVMAPVKDNSRSYIEEYNRRRAELENGYRQSGRRNAMEEFDLLYGSGSAEKKTTRKPSKKKSGKRPTGKRK